ncbi:MAG: cistern family PEP-CTERM protein [Candidatus Korobacteraceae bacterium]
MKRTALLFAVVALLALTPSVWADSFTVGSGGSFVAQFGGAEPINGPLVPGLTAEATFSGFTFTPYVSGPNTYTNVAFSVLLKNTSTAPVTGSRIANMAFNTNPNIVLNPPGAAISSVSGAGWSLNGSGNFPYGVGTVEFCFTSNNCAAGPGPGNGVTQGNQAVLTASLYFSGSISSLTFDNIYIKWQSVNCPTCSPAIQDGSFGGSGTGGQPIPEPATLSLLGGGAAVAWFRRRNAIKK